MVRILGIDFGDSRTGVAVSDPLGWTAQGLETVKGGMNATAERVAQLAEQYGAEAIVVGYPYNMDGTAGFRAERTDMFIAALDGALLRKTEVGRAVGIVKWDERLTSAEAAKTLRATGVKHTSRRGREEGKLDILSAVILLQSYLDRRRTS